MVTMTESLNCRGKTYPTDDQGFLSDYRVWTEELAHCIAQRADLELTGAHFEILYLLRRLYVDFDLAPANRALVRVVRESLGRDKGSSMYLMQLFGGSPAKEAARIAGLPKPPHCL